MKCLDKKRIKMKGGETLALNERIMLSLVSHGVSELSLHITLILLHRYGKKRFSFLILRHCATVVNAGDRQIQIPASAPLRNNPGQVVDITLPSTSVG